MQTEPGPNDDLQHKRNPNKSLCSFPQFSLFSILHLALWKRTPLSNFSGSESQHTQTSMKLTWPTKPEGEESSRRDGQPLRRFNIL